MNCDEIILKYSNLSGYLLFRWVENLKINEDSNSIVFWYKTCKNLSTCERFAAIWMGPCIHLGYCFYKLGEVLVNLAKVFFDVDALQDAKIAFLAACLSFLMIPCSLFINPYDFVSNLTISK